MRIISGTHRGKKLKVPSTYSIRPTQDRLKESLFNVLSYHYPNNLKDKNILDLFSGSGSLGIECISRGAKQVIFLDSSIDSLTLTKQNLASINSLEKGILIKGDSTKIKLEYLRIQFSLVFLDPPYDSNLIKESIEHLLKQDIFTKDCLFVLESNKEVVLDLLVLKLSKKVGENFFQIYSLH